MPGSTTLAVSNIVNVTVSLSPTAARLTNFGACLLVGSTDVIDVAEAIRTYTSASNVAADFGVTAPEYLAAVNFFAQSPQPQNVQIARWAEVATSAKLKGAALTPTQQLLSNFTAITAGVVAATINGTLVTSAAINLSGATTLPGVAALVQAGIGATVTCVWNPVYFRFELETILTGTASSLSFATVSPLATLLGLTQASGASVPVSPGVVAESPLACVARLANYSNSWYSLMFADNSPTIAQLQAVAAFIEAATPSRIFGISSSASGIQDPTSTTDLAYLLNASGYRRTMLQYTTAVNDYAVITSLLARAQTVNYTGANTTITLKFKQEPGVTPEFISQSAANALEAKGANIFVNYNNGTAILEQGTMVNGNFIDEVINLDWLQNAIQTNVYNVLYQSTTKIPQTDSGMHVICAVIETTCEGAVNNGMLAPGQWNAAGFGQLATGQYLSKGYYVYCPPISTQSQALRETRVTPLIQTAVKMAGAVHFANVAISVNR